MSVVLRDTAADCTDGIDGCASPARHRAATGRPRAVSGRPAKVIAVALHDVEPATFERCALMRDWLYDHGVDRVTLLVIPARDLHPAGHRSPQMIEWLGACRRAGDAIAQHGFKHQRATRPGWRPSARDQLPGCDGAEFRGLDAGETRRAVEAGWRLLKLDGIEPTGFVAPAYAYTRALREALAAHFSWWAGLLRVHGRGAYPGVAATAPALCLDPTRLIGRALSPTLIRVGAALGGHTLRLDLHPADVSSPRHMLALENVLRRQGQRRTAVNYDEIAALAA